MSRGAPILLLCLGRPELLDRPAGMGRRAAERDHRPARAALAGGDRGADRHARRRPRRRISRRGSATRPTGNPLFVEEMAAMVAEAARGDVVVPPTVQALLAARLDQLDGEERSVLERGAVEGQVFHRGAVAGARLPRCDAAGCRRSSARSSSGPRRAPFVRRRRLSLPAYPDPRCRLRRAAEGDPCRAARALCALARAARRGSGRAGRDPRLPPRAGLSLPRRARAGRRRGASARGARGAAAGRGRRSARTARRPRAAAWPARTRRRPAAGRHAARARARARAGARALRSRRAEGGSRSWSPPSVGQRQSSATSGSRLSRESRS